MKKPRACRILRWTGVGADRVAEWNLLCFLQPQLVVRAEGSVKEREILAPGRCYPRHIDAAQEAFRDLEIQSRRSRTNARRLDSGKGSL